MSKLVYGVGTNDAGYVTQWCPYYKAWLRVLSHHSSCTIDPEWLHFSNFKSWMKQQDWKGKNKHIDKSLLVIDNNHYGPDTCCFVSVRVTSLLRQLASNRVQRAGFDWDLPKGVYRYVGKEGYYAMSTDTGFSRFLGDFKDVGAASRAYATRKRRVLYRLAKKEHDPRVKQAIIFRACLL